MANITVNPTRMELTRLKKKLKTSQRGHKLLKDKRDELMKQFLDTVREVRALRAEVEEELMTVHKSFTVASALMSSEALEQALRNAANYDKKILVEEFINGREVEVAVLGNDAPAASVCGEIDAGTEFYDYDAKYISDCARLHIPARIDEETSERVRDTAIRIFEAMGCRGFSRVDFFVTYSGNEIVFNEINTIPGFTSISMYPKLFAASGIPYPELLDDLIELATEQ